VDAGHYFLGRIIPDEPGNPVNGMKEGFFLSLEECRF